MFAKTSLCRAATKPSVSVRKVVGVRTMATSRTTTTTATITTAAATTTAATTTKRTTTTAVAQGNEGTCPEPAKQRVFVSALLASNEVDSDDDESNQGRPLPPPPPPPPSPKQQQQQQQSQAVVTPPPSPKQQPLPSRRTVVDEETQTSALSPQPYPLPNYWSTSVLSGDGGFGSRLPCCSTYVVPPALVDRIAHQLATLSHSTACPACPAKPQQPLVVTWMLRVENPQLWAAYACKRAQIQARHAALRTPVQPYTPTMREIPDFLPEHKLDHCGTNEFYLLHGTTLRALPHILAGGFDERVASLTSCLYGVGTYFTDQACKALQYTDLGRAAAAAAGGVVVVGETSAAPAVTRGYLILSRVTLGVCHVASWQQPYSRLRRAPPVSSPGAGSSSSNNNHTNLDRCDCVVAEQGVANRGQQLHREFVVYDGAQAYPEYVVEVEVGSLKNWSLSRVL